MTLQTPGQVPDRAVSLRLEGVARIEGKSVTRPVVPAEDMMQAFLYRHLVPSQELLVAVLRPRWRLGPYEVVGRTPLQIRAGETATVRVRGPVPPAMTKIDLALVEPPAGVSLGDVSIRPGGLTFQLVTDADAIEGELRDNLILEATAEMGPSPQEQQQNPQAKPRKVPLGSLPAIGIEIVVEKDAVAQGGV